MSYEPDEDLLRPVLQLKVFEGDCPLIKSSSGAHVKLQSIRRGRVSGREGNSDGMAHLAPILLALPAC